MDRLRQWKNPDPQPRDVVEYAACLNAAMKQITKPEVAVNHDMMKIWKKTILDTVRIGKLDNYFLNAYGCRVEDFPFETAVLSPS